jgi:hypothetical protein
MNPALFDPILQLTMQLDAFARRVMPVKHATNPLSITGSLNRCTPIGAFWPATNPFIHTGEPR